MTKRRFLVPIVILLIIGGAGAWFYLQKDKPANQTAEQNGGTQTPAPVNDPTSIRLVATGDMIGHDSINANAEKADGGYDYLPMMDQMKPLFERADVRFCNQATPAGGESFKITGYPSFNAPVEFARGIEEVGCNLINIGTNHTNDKGQPLIDATVAAWDNRPKVLAIAGANRSAEEQNKVRYFETKGVKFAFLSYVTYTNNGQLTAHGVNMWRDDLVKTQMTEARAQADFVIVSMRWGTEYSPGVSANQVQKAQTLSDLGADAILGHGPHVLEPVNKLTSSSGRETLVWYSLGNFLNSQIDIESLIGGFAVMDIDIATKKITDFSFLPVYMHYEWTAEEKKQEDLLKRKNFEMYTLDQAADALSRSQNKTTVPEQTDRVRQILSKFIPVKIITSTEY